MAQDTAQASDRGLIGSRLRRVSDAALRLLILGLVAWALLWGLVYIRVVVIPIILAVFVTALLMPFANWLRRRGMGRGLSTLITVLGSLILFTGVFALVIPPAIAGSSDLVASVTEAVQQLERIAAALGLDQQTLNQWVDNAVNQIRSNSSRIVSGALSGAVLVVEIIIGLILTLVLTVYFVHSGDRLMEWTRGLFPQPTRRPLETAGEVTYGVMGRYVRGIALVGLFDAIGIGVFLIFLIDPTLAIALIVLTFIGAFLPVVGAFATGLLAALVAFVTEGWIVALIVVGVTLLVQQLESHLFAPRVYGKALDLPSPVVLIAIAVGSIVGGLIGAFLATPVAAVIAALLRDNSSATAVPGAGGSATEGRAAAASGPPGRKEQPDKAKKPAVSGDADADADTGRPAEDAAKE